MKPAEMIALMKKENPKLLKGIDDKQAVKIVRETLAQIRGQIESTNEGRVGVPGLGSFVIKQVEPKAEGKSQSVKRVIFRGAKGK